MLSVTLVLTTVPVLLGRLTKVQSRYRLWRLLRAASRLWLQVLCRIVVVPLRRLRLRHRPVVRRVRFPPLGLPVTRFLTTAVVLVAWLVLAQSVTSSRHYRFRGPLEIRTVWLRIGTVLLQCLRWHSVPFPRVSVLLALRLDSPSYRLTVVSDLLQCLLTRASRDRRQSRPNREWPLSVLSLIV